MRRTKRTPPPRPPEPTPEELDARFAEGVAALADASEAVSHLRYAVDLAVRQREQIRLLSSQLNKFEIEKFSLEQRLLTLLSERVPNDVKLLRTHATRMRRCAVFWEQEAVKLGHGGKQSLRDYHHAKHF